MRHLFPFPWLIYSLGDPWEVIRDVPNLRTDFGTLGTFIKFGTFLKKIGTTNP